MVVSCREVSKYRDISRYLPLPVNLYIAIYRAIYAKWLAINDNDICLKNSDKYTNAKRAGAKSMSARGTPPVALAAGSATCRLAGTGA